MVSGKINIEKARDIVNVLPQKNCGKCGFENCGKFALAAISGEASPFGCHQDLSAGYAISRILGMEVPKVFPGQSGSLDGTSHSNGHGKHHGGYHRFGHHRHCEW